MQIARSFTALLCLTLVATTALVGRGLHLLPGAGHAPGHACQADRCAAHAEHAHEHGDHVHEHQHGDAIDKIAGSPSLGDCQGDCAICAFFACATATLAAPVLLVDQVRPTPRPSDESRGVPFCLPGANCARAPPTLG